MSRSNTACWLPLAMLAGLAACERATPEEEPASKSATAGSSAAGSSANVIPAPGSATQPGTGNNAIPAGFHGRWGLTQGDCEKGPAATGLLVVSPAALDFYESMANLQEVEESAPTSIRAAFAFEGEGMSWHRDLTLSLENGGETLVLREFGEDAAPEPFRYTKC
jgi:hypothetical protein